jgi:hypothetical protein
MLSIANDVLAELLTILGQGWQTFSLTGAKKHFISYLPANMQVVPVIVLVPMQVMKHISGSHSILRRFESDTVDMYFVCDLQVLFAN